MRNLLFLPDRGWIIPLLFMFLFQGALLSFTAESFPAKVMVCPDNGNTSLIEMDGRFEFCIGDTATYIATFTGATDPTVTFYWDANGDGIPDPGEELPNPVIVDGDNFSIELEMTSSLDGGRIIVVFEDSDCMGEFIRVASTFPLIVDCGIAIEDPCTCENNAFLPGSGQFSETIVVSSLPGENWEVIAVDGLYQTSAGVPPAPGEEIQPGEMLTVDPMDNTRYLLEGKHIDGQGYSITVSNSTDTLSISNLCYYPNPQINLLPDYCINYPAFNLEVTDENHTGTFIVLINGNPATVFDPGALGPGFYVVSYTFMADDSGDEYPGCTQTNYAFVTIYDNYDTNLSCVTLVHASLSDEGIVVVTPPMILSDDFGCMSTFNVNILGNDSDTLTCEDVNQFFNVIISDPIRGGSCMGTIKIEDKTPPVFVCEDVTVSCTEDIFTMPPDAFIDVSDNCGDVSLILLDISPINNPSCHPDFSASFTRTLLATDGVGNTSTCVQMVFLDRPDLADIDFPADTLIEGCANGTPISPDITGYPTIDGQRVGFFCEFSIFYNDIPFTTCEGSRLVQRMWTIMDHCGAGAIVGSQDILISDVEPPQITCPDDLTMNTDVDECTTSYTIPQPIVSDNCVPESSINIIVFVNGVPRSPGQTVTLNAGSNTLIYQVNDPCLNYNSCTQMIEVEDNQSPELFCNNTTVALNNVGTVTVDPNTLAGVIAQDNCGVVELLISKIDGPVNFMPTITYDCSEIGPNIAAIQATDAAGNINSCVFMIEVQDNLGPEVTYCPPSDILECGIDDLPAFEDATFSENCPTQLIIDFDEDIEVGCCGAETITRTWTATDLGGNTAQCIQVLEFEDTTAPNLLCEASVTLSLDENGEAIIAEDDVIISVDDACCTDLTIDFVPPVLDCSDIGAPVTVTVTVTDECTNSSTCEVDVTVEDNLAPVFTNCLDTINFLVSDFNVCAIAFYNAMVETPEAIDNCAGIVSVSRSFVNQQSFCGGADPGIRVRVYTFEAMDDYGNVSTCTTVVRIIDDVDPIVTCEQDVEIFLDAAGEVSIDASALLIGISDFCDVSASLTDETFNFTCDHLGEQFVTIRATDCAGNEGTCISRLIISDAIDPVITCPADITVECLDNNGDPTDPDFTGFATAADNCTVEDIAIIEDLFSGSTCTGVLLRTFEATDQSGNTHTCVQSITVEDNLPPVSLCVDPIEFVTTAECTGSDFDTELDYIVEANRTLIADCYQDGCSNDVIVDDDFDINNVVMDCEDFGGTITVTYTVSDSCGNVAAMIPLELQIVDRTGPEFTLVPADITLECGDPIPVPDLGLDIEAVDECSMVSNISYEDFPVMTPWIITAQPGNAQVDLSNAPDAITITGSSTEVLQNLIAIVSSAAKAGTLSFDWTYETEDEPASDPFGISIGGVTTFIVDDFPQIQSGSESFAVTAGAEIIFFVETIDNFYGSATVEITNIQFTPDAMECPVVECYIRRFIAEDACGNYGAAYQLITIVDTEAPAFLCQNITLQLNADGEAILNPEDAISDESDNCTSNLTYGANRTLFTCDDLIDSPITVTLSVTDECGNTGTCEIDVTIEDNIAPVIMCPDTVTFFLSDHGDMCVGYQALIPNPPASDNCEVVSITRSGSGIEGFCGGSQVGVRLRNVVFEATDASGNSGTCDLILKIVDDVAPVLECETTYVVELDANGMGSVLSDDLLINIEDSCTANPQLVSEVFNFTCDDIGTSNFVILTGTDCAGNEGTCEVQIDVQDNIDPVVSCVAAFALELDANGMASVTAESLVDVVSDNCSDTFVTTASQTQFDCSDVSISPVTVTVTVTDEQMNTATCTVDITIEDNTAPVFTNCEDQDFELSVVGDCSFDDFMDASFFNLTANDACDGAISIGLGSMTISEDFCDNMAQPLIASGNTIFEVTDMSGNTATCTINWTLENDVPPNLTCDASFDLNLDMSGTATLDVNAIATTSYPIPGCFGSVDLTINGQIAFDCTDVGQNIEVQVIASTCGSPDSTCMVNINIIDPDPVMISCPADAQVFCGADIDVIIQDYIDNEFDVSGICLMDSDLVIDTLLNDCGVGTVLFTFSATSEYGTDSTCTSTLTVALDPSQELEESDIIWPVDYLSLCGDIDSSETGAPEITVIGDCFDLELNYTDEVVNANDNGCEVRARTWTVSEECYGVMFTHIQEITRPLPGIPLQTAPSNVIVANDSGMCGADINLTLVTGPACDPTIVVTNDFNMGGADASGFYPVGVTVVSYTLTNSCGEMNTHEITVEVVDTQAPSVNCSPNSLNMICSDDPMDIVNGFTVIYSDNCPMLSIDTLFNFNLNDCGVGNIQVIFRAADAYNNVGSCSRLIHVSADPGFSLQVSDFIWPSDTLVGCDADISPEILGEPELVITLPCADIILSFEDTVVSDQPEIGCNLITRTWTAIDLCSGTEVMYDQMITQAGVMPVIVSGPIDVTVSSDPDTCGTDVIIDQLTFHGCAEPDYSVINDYNNTDDASDFYPVGNTLVTFMVTNSCGNTTTFVVSITVEDNTAPVVMCPADATITCEEDPDVFISGLTYEATDACGIINTDVSYPAPVLTCGAGSTTVTFTATDTHGNTQSCTFVVTIDPVFLSEMDIVWPDTFYLSCGQDSSNLTITGAPEFDSFCGAPVADHSDGALMDDSGCRFFIRTWMVSDSCSGGVFIHEQTIYVPVYDDLLTLVAMNQEFDVANDPGECGAALTILFPITGYCAPDVTISNDYNDGGADASDFYPVDTTVVNYTISNACGVIFTDQATVVVSDFQNPVLECGFQTSTVTCADNLTDVVINDFIINAEDNCSMDTTIQFTFNLNDCGVGTVDFVFTVTDQNMNTNACTRTITISASTEVFVEADIIWPESPLVVEGCDTDESPANLGSEPELLAPYLCLNPMITFEDEEIVPTDNPDYCRQILRTWLVLSGCDGDTLAQFAQTIYFEAEATPIIVNGVVATAYGDGVLDVLISSTSSNRSTTMSNETGEYFLSTKMLEQGIEVVPTKEDSDNHGLTTADILAIIRHIHGVKLLDSPYKIIAADVDRDNRITPLDIIPIREVILGRRTSLPNGNWRFVDAEYQFNQPTAPLKEDFNETVHITNSDVFPATANFVAVQLGDAAYTLQKVQNRFELPVHYLFVNERSFEPGQSVEMILDMNDFASVDGFQFTINYDIGKLQLQNIEFSDVIHDRHVNLQKAVQGWISFAWDKYSSEAMTESRLVRLEFTARSHGRLSDALQIDHRKLKPEVYLNGIESAHVPELKFREDGFGIGLELFELYQNQPNPFNQFTLIPFVIPEEGEVKLSIYDTNGKSVHYESQWFSRGSNHFILDQALNGMPDGIYYYRIDTGKGFASKKMIKHRNSQE